MLIFGTLLLVNQESRGKQFGRWLLLAVQICVSVGLLYWLLSDARLRGDITLLLAEAQWGWLGIALLVAGVGCIVGFFRWGIFLRVVGIRLSWWEVIRMAAIGLFFNNFLPGSVGGDAVKVGWLAAKKQPVRRGLLSVVMDRMGGIGALVLCSVVFIGLRYEWLCQSPIVGGLIHFVFLYLGVVVTLLATSFVLAARGSAGDLPQWVPARAQLIDFASTYTLFVREWRATLVASSLSVIMLLAYFLTFFFCALALGVDVPFLNFMAFMPAVDIIAALPVSLGGFGVREGAFATILGQLTNVPTAAAVTLSFAGALMNLAWGALGIFLLPAYRRSISQQ